MDDLHVNRHCYLCVAPGMDALLLTDFLVGPSNPWVMNGENGSETSMKYLGTDIWTETVCLFVCLSAGDELVNRIHQGSTFEKGQCSRNIAPPPLVYTHEIASHQPCVPG